MKNSELREGGHSKQWNASDNKFHVMVASFLLGATFLCILSFCQKLFLGVSPFPLRGYVVPFLFGGVVGLIFGIWRMRLERNIAQHAESERRFRDLLETISDWVWEVDRNGVYTYSSPQVKTLLGYEPEEVIGKTPFDFMPQQEAKRISTQFRSLIKSQQAIKALENVNIHKDGRQVVLETKGGAILAENGELLGYRGIDRDVTERKKVENAVRESEARYRDLFENASDLIQIVGSDGRILFVNRAWRETFGYSEQELSGLSIFDIIHPECDTHCQETFSRVMTEGRVDDIETIFLSKDGKKILVEGSATCNFKDGKPTFSRCIFRNVTEQRKLEDQLRQSQKMEAIGTLAGGIAHDFNNILNALLGYTELAMFDLQKETAAYKNLEEVIKSGKRAAELVKQILTFSRQTEYRKKPLLMQSVVNDTLKLLHQALPATIEIRQNIDKNCRPIQADASQIYQVVMNLCTNAYHSMREQGGELAVELHEIEIDSNLAKENPELVAGPGIHLAVSDTGHGIDKQTAERIFEPYFTTKKTGEGTGLGLATVHGIVQNHHGVIKVESEIGIGTKFNIYFPVLTDGSVPVEEEIAPVLPTCSGRILFVDDEESITQLGKAILERMGCEVKAFTDSEKALAAFEADPDGFAVVITDQTMPGLTGLEFSKKILEIRSGTPIILLTGFSELVNEEQAKAAGIKEYFLKPLTVNDLSKAVSSVLAQDDTSI